jgi:hypothetical protein
LPTGAAWFGHSTVGGMFLWARLSGVLPRQAARPLPTGEPPIEMDGPSNTRRAARKAEGSRNRLTTEWLVIPMIIVLVFVLAFGWKFLLA